MNSQQEDLEELEAERKRRLELLLLGLLLYANSEQELIFKLKSLSKDVYNEVMDIRRNSFSIADKHSEETHKVSDKDRKLIITAASLYMASTLARRVAVSTKATYLEKAREAISQSKDTVERLVATEVFEANMKKMVGNNPNQKFRWNAVFDKRTCATCEARDGKEYNAGDIPDYPHARCRCFVEIVSG